MGQKGFIPAGPVGRAVPPEEAAGLSVLGIPAGSAISEETAPDQGSPAALGIPAGARVEPLIDPEALLAAADDKAGAAGALGLPVDADILWTDESEVALSKAASAWLPHDALTRLMESVPAEHFFRVLGSVMSPAIAAMEPAWNAVYPEHGSLFKQIYGTAAAKGLSATEVSFGLPFKALAWAADKDAQSVAALGVGLSSLLQGDGALEALGEAGASIERGETLGSKLIALERQTKDPSVAIEAAGLMTDLFTNPMTYAATGAGYKAIAARTGEVAQGAANVTKAAQAASAAGKAAAKSLLLSAEDAAKLTNPIPHLRQAVQATDATVKTFKAALQDLDADRVTALAKNKTITDTLIDLIEDGTLPPEAGAQLFGVGLNKKDTVFKYAERLRQASTSFGQGLNRLSQAKASFMSRLKKDSELARLVDAAFAEAESERRSWSLGRRVWNHVAEQTNDVLRVWTAMLTVQPVTAIRNMETQGVRLGLGLMDDAINGTLRAVAGSEPPRKAYSNFTEHLLSLGRRTFGQNQELDKVLGLEPWIKQELLSHPMGDLVLSDEILAKMNILNTTQESFFRKVAFDGRLRSNLIRSGFEGQMGDPSGLLGQLLKGNVKQQKFARRILSDSIEHALEMTFARTMTDGLSQSIYGVYRAAPVMRALAYPFPRYWTNALHFVAEFSPVGFMFTDPSAKNPEMRMRGISRGVVGTMSWAAALAIRHSEYAGDRYYEVKTDPHNHPEKQMDVRSQHPVLAPQLFIAEFLKRTEEIAQGKRGDYGFSQEDVANALVALKRAEFSGIPLVDAIFFGKDDITRSTTAFMKGLKKFAGDFLGGFGVPFRPIRDFNAVLNEQGKLDGRFTERSPLTGPLAESMPFVRDALPEKPSLTRPGVETKTDVLKRMLSGVATKDKTAVERMLDQHDITARQLAPRGGHPEIDRIARGKMGNLIPAFLVGLTKSDFFLRRPFDERKFIIAQIVDGARLGAVSWARGERADLAAKVKLDPRTEMAWKRDLLDPAVQEILPALEAIAADEGVVLP